MGRFLNPGNKAFQKTLKSEIYVDKTMLLAYTNKVIGSDMACICNSRPRRFGKSITANMLAAYYSRGCDSFDMFSTLKVGRLDSFETNLNKYDVIHIDVQWCMMDAGEVQNTVKYINNGILDEYSYLDKNAVMFEQGDGGLDLAQMMDGTVILQ